MGKLVQIVEKLELATKKLILKQQDLQQKNKVLEEIITDKENTIKSLSQRLEQLQLESKNLKTANALLGSKDYKRETKLKINRLIKEIDACIVQLAD
ncbi:MAG: hypothetical protein ACTHY4_00970 [Flavobacteriaceae bacterium]|nr:hypothetical protein [Psychroflexus sp.]